MTTPPNALPDQWTISLHPVANLTILTLLDGAGKQREIGFHSINPPGTADRTVSTLEEIPEDALRTSAQTLIDTFYERTAQAQANADAFGAAVPDWKGLADRLHSAVPGCLAGLDVDDEALTVVVKLAAAGPAAGLLLSLITRWPGSTTPDGTADGVHQDLDEAGGLTVLLDQTRAEQFLTWYRDQS